MEINTPWIETVTGKKFPFLNPQPEDIDIKDIAHALSMNCRFVGQCREFYSVAEHSWNVARMLEGFPKEVQIAGLLHDASEAYITDVASPVKQYLPEYNKLEDIIMAAIAKKYGFEYELHPAVKIADRHALSTEAHYLLPSQGNDWNMWGWPAERPRVDHSYRPLGMDHRRAKNLFLDKFHELTE